jgi:hypothetical protein
MERFLYHPQKVSLVRLLIVVSFILFAFSSPAGASNQKNPFEVEDRQISPLAQSTLFLPLVITRETAQNLVTVNLPQFSQNINIAETAISWFGKITATENYGDIRLGYTEEFLWVRVNVVDRLLFHSVDPSPSTLQGWDSISLFLLPASNSSASSTRYRFDGQLNWHGDRQKYQAAHIDSGAGWNLSDISFDTLTDWRGNAPNDTVEDRGWWIRFRIPFSSLGLNGTPAQGTAWKLGLALHDRDDQAGTPIAAKQWPQDMNISAPGSWARIVFGLPAFHPPASVNQTTIYTIRRGLSQAQVKDGMVGGSSICGEGLAIWTDWGNKNYAGAEQVNVQNEEDLSDFPCFSKFYIIFPLDSLPLDQQVVSAALTLYQIGNAGGGQWGPPADSFVQVLTVDQDWDERTLTWNNAPTPLENVSQTWVLPMVNWPSALGVPWQWDLSRAVDEAYRLRKPLRLVLYSADAAYNTGRYFSSSDIGEWSANGRPTLEIKLGR